MDVSPILDVLNPILGNEYVTIEFTMSMDTADSSTSSEDVHVVAHVKNTGDGYDLVATMDVSSSYTYEDETHASVESYQLYFVDGTVLLGGSFNNSPMEY